MALIGVDGLSKSYRVAEKQPVLAGTLRHFIWRRTLDVVAVQNVSFRIEPGEMVGFLGANGAGKPTTLKMLCGLIHPSAGEARGLFSELADLAHKCLADLACCVTCPASAE